MNNNTYSKNNNINMNYLGDINIPLLILELIAVLPVSFSIAENSYVLKGYKKSLLEDAKSHDDVISKYEELNEEELYKKKYSGPIIYFFRTIREKIPEVNLSILFNNFNEINTVNKSFSFFNKLLLSGVAGRYKPKENTIELSNDTFDKTVFHELFHASSTFYDKENNMIYSGFHQIDMKDKTIGSGINEGYTQYLTVKYFGEDNTYKNSYLYERMIVKLIEDIVGEKEMRSYYFNADLNGLMNNLSKYSPYEEVKEFIKNMDFLNTNSRSSLYFSKVTNMIKASYRDVNSFILKTNLRKEVIEMNREDITEEKLIEVIEPVKELLPFRIKTLFTKYEVSDDNLVTDAVESVLSEIESKNKVKKMIL